MQKVKACIYGDSIMKGTIMDERNRYHATVNAGLERFGQRFGITMENHARFGLTIDKAYGQMQKDMQNGLSCEYAVIEFGGNDCNFNWAEVAALPYGKHHPVTRPEVFERIYLNFVGALRQHGVIPVLTTLPPIDAERFLAFLERRGKDAKRILKWLGDVQMIYRFHESYSNIVRKIARTTCSYLVDVRTYFLDKHNYRELICEDGMHPSSKGYELVFNAFEDFVTALRCGAPALA